MEPQDGIDVRPMRLKVLYTFDSENKTNCLARWPHVLDIQTAYLDETTPIGVIELKTCIQAIVSASPELVAQLGKDYTVYAYDYSEYETPLVGQGMLSWVLSSASPTEAQSKTMVTGRVCKNTLGLFSKGAAQETLEVKLRLVPVPTVMQSEYLDSIQKYRDLSNFRPGDFDAQSWSNFVRQNPALGESSRAQSHAGSPMHHSGIERFHQLLSEGSTPREFSNFPPNESVRSVSPSHSYAPSRVSTPGGRTPAHHQSYKHSNPHSDMIRPSSSASMRDNDFQSQVSYHQRRGSMQSGYGSGEEESTDPQPRKRAKVYQASWPGKSALNIERQPSSLRVAASTAASVRIHRPTPVNPAIAAEQSFEDPVRPPTPMSRPSDFNRRSRPTGSLLRESSIASIASCPATYNSPYCQSDDMPGADQTSPDDTRYQGLFEPSFSMPSSPPVFDGRLLNRSSPVLPPIALDTDSGFMSAGLEDLLDEETTTPQDDRRRAESHEITQEKRPVRSTVQASSPASTIGAHQGTSNDPLPVDEMSADQLLAKAPPVMSRPATSTGSRPSSSAGPQRLAPKPLLPGPIAPIAPQNQCHPLMRAIPASDPVVPSRPVDVKFMPLETKNNAKGKRTKQAINMQARLEQAIAKGEVPPYCENCGSIETPSWRRAWAKEVEGNDKLAEEMMQQPLMLFWDVLDRNAEGEVQKFLIYKKENEDHWKQMTYCNPCGLWLHKFKEMRPQHKWSKGPAAKKRKRPARITNGKPSNSCPATRTRSKATPGKPAASSPAATEASSVPAEGETPQMDDDEGLSPNKRSRENSTEPQHLSELATNWNKQDAREAMRRAIRSSPARRTQPRPTSSGGSTASTPKPLRRSLFPNEGPLKEIDASMVNSCSPRRSPRIASTKDDKGAQKENHIPTPADDLDNLFESPSIDFDHTGSPTPRRRNARVNAATEKRPMNSPSANRRKELSSVMTPTRLSAERLQRIQASQHNPRQNKSPNKQQPFAPLTTDESIHSEAFESLDGMILDIFDDADQPNHFFLQNAKFDGDNWADWLPEDYVSPNGSSDEPAEDLINSLFSNSEVNKDNLNSEFLPFNFDESVIPDSGFFSSDALQTDPIRLAPKTQSASHSHDTQQANSSA
ncbi:uncharacterized protein N7511_006335 [Penicillium nucicola]|uniref:uncharacterized protein n=1 Tax=Penicillium nucicola TaxID=1850975 RepID=UPI0025450DAC|nr:uncharacterized protein N7511_006335 [Penicillium nucicola]KAJ5757641.1 hypothetical protein N7511_006335 [Penicillium nucicola]